MSAYDNNLGDVRPLPDGEYNGRWCGWEIEVEGLLLKAPRGLRGWADVTVTVKDGIGTFETRKHPPAIIFKS